MDTRGTHLQRPGIVAGIAARGQILLMVCGVGQHVVHCLPRIQVGPRASSNDVAQWANPLQRTFNTAALGTTSRT